MTSYFTHPERSSRRWNQFSRGGDPGCAEQPDLRPDPSGTAPGLRRPVRRPPARGRRGGRCGRHRNQKTETCPSFWRYRGFLHGRDCFVSRWLAVSRGGPAGCGGETPSAGQPCASQVRPRTGHPGMSQTNRPRLILCADVLAELRERRPGPAQRSVAASGRRALRRRRPVTRGAARNGESGCGRRAPNRRFAVSVGM